MDKAGKLLKMEKGGLLSKRKFREMWFEAEAFKFTWHTKKGLLLHLYSLSPLQEGRGRE